MSADALKPLMFTVGLVDKITGPAQKATKSFDGLVNTAKTGFRDMAAGAIGLAGTGALIYQSLTPAIEMNRALKEVESLGVQEKALQDLNISALEFSSNYGVAADEFVSASYKIQSGIAGLQGNELSSFTTASGILAKSTKSDVDTITDYMATMYNVFSENADKMGRSNWVEMVSGQTAAAIRMFKTSGTEMASGFSSLGATATKMGVQMSEQIAVLGTLQGTMSGSEAATKYNSFLGAAVSAQDKLGLSFFDTTGNMKSMSEIMKILESEIGHLDKAAQYATLKDAFGTDEAVKLIQLLISDSDKLAGSIAQIGEIQNMDNAKEMAETMVDPWMQLSAGIDAVRIAIGQALLPVLNPLIDTMAAASREVLYWTKLFPNITKLIGLTVITILALGAGMAALTIAAGLGKSAWAGFLMVMKLGRVVTMAVAAAQWAMNAAFIASPVGLIVIGITGLVAVLYAAWMGIKALWSMFADTTAGEGFMAMIQGIVDWFTSLGGIVDWVIEKLNKIPGVSIGAETEQPELPSQPAPALPEAMQGIAELPGFRTEPEQAVQPVAIPLLPEPEASTAIPVQPAPLAPL